MLFGRAAGAERLLRLPGLSRLGANRTFSYLAARTLFYDEQVRRATADGITQVVVLGAGYDTRAWRLAHPGVRFFEVDRPATQEDKRQRAPCGDGPTFVPADLATDALDGVLPQAGFVIGERTLFTAEGLTMYLPEAVVVALLSAAGHLSGPGSRLAANFGVGFDTTDSDHRSGRRVLARQGEPIVFELAPAHAPTFFAVTGWQVDDLLTGPQLGARYLDGRADADLPNEGLNARAFAVAASRT
jgi:methyltransferase (TIGR00027 family)